MSQTRDLIQIRPAQPDYAEVAAVLLYSAYTHTHVSSSVRSPVDGTPVPLGVARTARSGRDVTIVATQLMVHRSLAATERLMAKDDIDCEIIDLRTLYPLDLDAVVASAHRTRHVLVCHEAPLLYGFGVEIAAAISETCWRELEAPVHRIGGARTPIPYAAELEAGVLPSEERIEKAVCELMRRPNAFPADPS